MSPQHAHMCVLTLTLAHAHAHTYYLTDDENFHSGSVGETFQVGLSKLFLTRVRGHHRKISQQRW